MAGVVQSIAVPESGIVPGYWSAMLPDVRPRSVLLLGLGGGTVARLLIQRFGPIPILGVELRQDIADLAVSAFGLGPDTLSIVVADAFEFMRGCQQRFDYIAVDLYVGPELVTQALGKPFLRDVRRCLAPGGVAVYNLVLSRRLPKYLHRLAQVFRVDHVRDVELNVVVFLR